MRPVAHFQERAERATQVAGAPKVARKAQLYLLPHLEKQMAPLRQFVADPLELPPLERAHLVPPFKSAPETLVR